MHHTVLSPAPTQRAARVAWRYTASGPRFRTPFGFLAVMRHDPLGFLMECARRYGDVVEMQFPPWRGFLLTHPDGVKHVLQENHHNYWKGIVFAKLKRVAGEGLVFSDGELWRRQRQLIQPAFHRERITAMAEMMVETTTGMLDRWRSQAAAGQGLDVASEMSSLTLEIVSKALFGTDLGADQAAFTDAVTAGLAYANHLVNHMLALPMAIPTAANRRGRRAIAALDRIVWKIIAQRRREPCDRGDLLAMLLTASDAETNEPMDDKQLRDECITFLIAGHETTAVALSWAWHLLSTHPSTERRLHAEVDEVLGDRLPTLRDLAGLPYVRMVLEESMRLYPPVWATNRQAYADDEIAGHRIPANSTVTVSPYVTHRNPVFWEEAEVFDPERFTPERSAARPEWAYFPFGGGPRGCVGRQFAMLEGQLVLAMVAQRFRLRNVPGHPIEAHPILTLRPRYGVRMTLHPRR
jgi:cytochrome P450